MRRAVVYCFWGQKYLDEALDSAATVKDVLDLPIVAITDHATSAKIIGNSLIDRVIVADFADLSLLVKTKLSSFLPDEFDSFLYLDTDVKILQPLTYAFEKSERFGIAACMAPHYSLNHFWGFGNILDAAGMPSADQLQYNTGVLFFTRRPDVDAVLEAWSYLADRFAPSHSYTNDQPFFTMAMELLGFNPFTLSPAYNYRALGELVSGTIRVWHSHSPVPLGVNDFSAAWPPRRFHGGVRVQY